MTDTDSKLAGLNILLGVTGGVAAYKAVDLASKLTAAGAEVTSVLTRNARKLATAKSFEAVTGRQVFTRLFNTPCEYHIGHISLAESADIVVVAPATANIIAKIANGICNDLLSTTLCACWDKPVLIVPAMNNQMWTNPAVRRNVETIKKMNFQFIGPETGRLACGTDAIGRMAEPADIVIALQQIAEKIKKT
jgi:phosphopantothenoylcysteine decarboxylase/phosphopantothenate--cysteine ligase